MSLLKLFAAPFDKGLVIKKYKIYTRKFPSENSLRIVLITDLHSNAYDNKQNEISQITKMQKPDIIALSGDIADAARPIEGAIKFVQDVQCIAPTYYCTGNHECRSKEYKHIIDAFKNSNITILQNKYEEITVNGVSLIIGGMDDPDIIKYIKPKMDWNKQLFENFSILKNTPQYKILISHRPELVELYKQTPFDMILSGHAHGGQVRIPFLLNGLFAPHQGFFPRHAGGLYNYANVKHIVSRGVSFSPLLPRIFNPPELVVIDIKGISK